MVRPVRPSQPEDRAIVTPARLKQHMDTLLLVHGVERGLVAPSRAACVREDQDALAPGHKGGGLGLAGARRAGFELLAAIARGDEPLGAPRHLGDIVVPEMLDRKSVV